MRKHKFITFGLLLFSSIRLLSAEPAVIHVPYVLEDVTFLLNTLKNANSGDTIKVAVGKYFLNEELTIPAGVIVIGGFKDGFAGENRIYPGAATEITQMTVFDGNSLVRTEPSKKHRVATVYGTLDGILIRNGHIRNGHGGGVYIANTGTVQNCIIKGNVAMYVPGDGSKMTPENAAHGGGVYIAGGNLFNCVVAYNMSNQGFGVSGEAGKMVNNTVTANTSAPESVLVEGGKFHHYKIEDHSISDPGEIAVSTFCLAKTEVTTSQYAVFANAVDLFHENGNIILASGYLSNAGLKKDGSSSNNISDLIDPSPGCQGSVDKVPAGSTVGVRYGFTSTGSLTLFSTNYEPYGLCKVGSDYVYNKNGTPSDAVDLHVNNESMSQVSWIGSLAFSLWLGGSLPTEAQWEFAARRSEAGSGDAACNTLPYAGSADRDAVAWHHDNNISYENIHEVAIKAPNAIGLYDMSGNVWEWCADLYTVSNDNYPAYGGGNSSVDPVWNIIVDSSSRVLRGGSWDSTIIYLSLSFRYLSTLGSTDYYFGFRPTLIP
ncbi:MAG: formylglycine-generating enzyme family protein [Dysgonamonadaceae bacterium]|jgi:formylglycine-generating enzyme required for sulfatase activity|nr:formylglycine-generating enzyme family protein [Dysgonamonadaceae bacterium]